ncbi:MAG: general secretion pathway protein GspB [Gammaproteobacteria bacterium]
MSYILDALRKSERERQVGQSPSLPLLVRDPSRRRRGLWVLVAALLAGNGVAWLYFGYSRGGATVQEAAESPHTRSAQENAGKSLVVAENTLPKSVTFEAEMKAAKPAIAAGRESSASHGKDSLLQKQVSAVPAIPKQLSLPTSGLPIKPFLPPVAKTAGNEKKAARHTETEKLETLLNQNVLKQIKESVTAPAVPVRKLDDKLAFDTKPDTGGAAAAAINDIRSRLPPLTVNVLAYASKPEERFAVINMTKYVHGDVIPGGAVLLEILPDGLLLELDGMKFRMPQR